MSKQFWAILFCIVVGLSANAQNRNERAIRKMLAAQVTEWNKANMEGFMKGYWENDSLLFIGSKGPTYGFGATLARYKKGYPDTDHTGTLTSTILSMKKLSPKYYFVVGKWALARKAGDVSGSYTLLIRKIKGEWVIVSDHSS